MSQVSREKHPAPSALASPARRQARPALLVWLPALVALIVSTIGFGLAAASCGPAQDRYPGLDGGPGNGGSSPGCIGPTCPAACAAHPGPGCACSVEGQHMSCGKVESTSPAEGTTPAQTMCGMGFSVCNDGTWSDCEITGATVVVPGAPAGYYAEGLAPGTPCANNPCDPACVNFPDTPTGITGTGLASSDAGVTLSGNGTPPCTPTTCAKLGFNCGVQSDGCGNALNCGTCNFPQTCGGGGHASVCGTSGSCTNLCLNQVTCSGTATTSISGHTYMPNGTTPLPNVLVYVPNSALSNFTNTVSCVSANNCTAEVSGSPLVATTSAVDGSFTLTNVPANVSFPVVMQLGRFRRVFTMPAVTSCANTAVPCTSPSACLSRFPTKQGETSSFDNIPKMAFSTGFVDALECVWAKVGINSTSNLYGTATGEFTPGNTQGRINLYYGTGNYSTYGGGAYIGNYGTGAGQTPQFEATVLDNQSLLDAYDMILFPCQGAQVVWSSPYQVNRETAVANYVNAGGRVFSTHYSYIWLYSDSADLGLACGLNGSTCSSNSKCCSLSCSGGVCASSYTSPLSPALVWSINQSYNGSDPTTGTINTSFTGGNTLATWLLDIGSSSTLGQMSINTIRHDFNGAVPPSEEWVSLPTAGNANVDNDPSNCGSCGNVCSGSTPICAHGTCAASCSSGYTLCGATCANTTSDPNNCGTCGNSCGGSICISGQCTSCAFSSTDPNNCGSCGNACGVGQLCSGGACACPGGLTYCSGVGACTNTTNDPNNCGTCGTACAAGEVCSGGACSACPSGYTSCSGTCTNTQTSATSCGTCGHACTGGMVCTSGACACPTGYLNCSGTCLESNANTTHCGTTCTATACTGTNKYCHSGACNSTTTCTGGLTMCNKACVNRNTDPGNCGACGTVCGGNQTCVAGSCTCASGTLCSGVCVTTATDPNNCGSCANVCPAGSSCNSGTCVAETGQAICSGSKVTNLQTDPSNCGTCGHACSYWLGCNSGTCSCPGGYTSCNHDCVDYTSDANNCGSCGKVCSNGQICSASSCKSPNQSTANNQTCAVPMQASFNSGPQGLATPTANMCGRVVYSDFHVESSNNTRTAFPGECSGGFSPQELMLAQALFDLAGCVATSNNASCVPTTCMALGVGCGTTGDGCGGTLNCGTCTSPATCGGGGVLNQCGIPNTFQSAQFIRDYNATGLCATGQHPVWREYSWTSVTPIGTQISYSIATATTLTGLTTVTPVPLQWSAFPGVPTGLTAGQPAIAQKGPPDTEMGGASPDATLLASNLPQNNNFLRVIATLSPAGSSAPTLSSWNMMIDCVDDE